MCVQLRYRKSLMLRKQLEEQRLEGGEGPQWDRLKVSLLKGPSTSTRSSPGTGRNGVSSRALRDSLVHMKTVRRDGVSPATSIRFIIIVYEKSV